MLQVQFVIGFVHSLQSLYIQCDFPRWMQWALVFYAISIFSLFMNFYYQAYINSAKKKVCKSVVL